MLLDIRTHLRYQVPRPTDLLMQIEVADLADQKVISANLDVSPTEHLARVTAENGLGERTWLRIHGPFDCTYNARIHLERSELDISSLPAVPVHLLPGHVVRYLMPSRFCPSDEFQTFVEAEFGSLTGGARITALLDWIKDAFTYAPGVSNAQTTAMDTFVQRRGVCRDFAHVMITLARASAVPARFASVYAPDVRPQDFHAVAELYLDGAWHLVDATGMASAGTIARIGVGMDAAEVAFLTAFGMIDFVEHSVSVAVVDR